MKLRSLLLGTLVLAGLLSIPYAPSQPPATPQTVSYTTDVLPFLTKHCASCHANGKKKGGVSFDKYKDNDSVLKDRATWDLVVEMVPGKKMPPPKSPQPTQVEVQGGDQIDRWRSGELRLHQALQRRPGDDPPAQSQRV